MQVPVNFYKVLNLPSEPATPDAIYFLLNEEDTIAEAYVTDTDGFFYFWGNSEFVLAVMAVSMALKANINSPQLTGIPTAPTADPETDTTQLATCEFVIATRDAILNAAPGVLDTLQELAAALGDDPDYAATTAALIGTKAAKADIIGPVLLSSVAVNLNDGTATNQALYTVPASRRGKPVRVEIDFFSDVPAAVEFTLGWNAGANDVIADPLLLSDLVTAAGEYVDVLSPSRSFLAGTAGQVLKLKVTTANGSALTARVNVYGSLTDASGVPITAL